MKTIEPQPLDDDIALSTNSPGRLEPQATENALSKRSSNEELGIIVKDDILETEMSTTESDGLPHSDNGEDTDVIFGETRSGSSDSASSAPLLGETAHVGDLNNRGNCGASANTSQENSCIVPIHDISAEDGCTDPITDNEEKNCFTRLRRRHLWSQKKKAFIGILIIVISIIIGILIIGILIAVIKPMPTDTHGTSVNNTTQMPPSPSDDLKTIQSSYETSCENESPGEFFPGIYDCFCRNGSLTHLNAYFILKQVDDHISTTNGNLPFKNWPNESLHAEKEGLYYIKLIAPNNAMIELRDEDNKIIMHCEKPKTCGKLAVLKEGGIDLEPFPELQNGTVSYLLIRLPVHLRRRG